MIRLMLVLICGIGVSGCATLGITIDLPEASTRFQEAVPEDAVATDPAPLPELPLNACETIHCPPGYTTFTDAQMNDLMRFVDVADANQRIGLANAGALRAREERINALLQMGMETEKQAALYREGWRLEYETRLWEVWTLRVGLGVAVVGLIMK